MAFYTSLESATEAVRNAKSFDDIVDVFRIFSRYGEMITAETADLIVSMESYIERINASPTPAVDVLYEFGAMAKSARNDAALIAVRNASPQNAQVLEKAAAVTPDEVKTVIIKSGKSIMLDNISDIRDKAEEATRLNDELKRLEIEFSSEKFQKIRNEIADKVILQIRREGIFDIPRFVISSIALGYSTYLDSRYVNNNDIIERIHSVKLSIVETLASDNPEYFELFKKIKSINDEIEKRENEVFNSVSRSLETLSGISKEEAQAWAKENVYIAPNVSRKLKKINYQKEQFISDMAEAYRYLGGKLGPVEFVLQKGTRRAFARGRTQICLDSDFNKTTLFHECGHLVEGWDRVALDASLSFVKNRAIGAPKPLKKLTTCSYRPDEKAFPDSFIDPYVGKDYQGEASEVFSMALQQMASPAHLVNFIKKDPEHFQLFLGICARQSPELSQKMREFELKAKEMFAAKDKEVKGRAELRGPWEKALRNAIPDGFSELLKARHGFAGYAALQDARKKSKWTLYQISEGGCWKGLYKTTLPSAARLAYLHIMNDRRGLPVHYSTASDAATDFFSFVCADAVPAWFVPEEGLPRLEV